MLKRTLFACVAALVLIASAQMMKAQDGGGFQMPSPEEMKQNMLDRIKTQAGVDDAAWKEIQPKVEAAMAKRLPSSGGMGMMGMFGGGPGGPGGPGGGPSPFAAIMGQPIEEQGALSAALNPESGNASDADIKAKTEAYVKAYKKRAEDAKKAQDELAKAVGNKAKLKAVLMLQGLIPVE